MKCILLYIFNKLCTGIKQLKKERFFSCFFGIKFYFYFFYFKLLFWQSFLNNASLLFLNIKLYIYKCDLLHFRSNFLTFVFLFFQLLLIFLTLWQPLISRNPAYRSQKLNKQIKKFSKNYFFPGLPLFESKKLFWVSFCKSLK